MATDLEVRKKAQDERDALKRTQAAAEFALAAAGVAAGILVAAPFVLAVMVPAVLKWRGSRELTAKERLVEDPPRPDYDRETWPRFERVREIQPPNADPAWKLLFEYARASVDAVAYQEAMVVAYERQLGAQENDRADYAAQRGAEVATFAGESAAALRVTSILLEQFPALLDRPEFHRIDDLAEWRGFGQRSDDLLGLIPDDVAVLLFRMGAPALVYEYSAIDSEAVDILGSRPFSTLAQELSSEIEDKRALAGALEVSPGASPTASA
jgi:hypothetical protein